MARGILTRQQILGTFCQESGCQVLRPFPDFAGNGRFAVGEQLKLCPLVAPPQRQHVVVRASIRGLKEPPRFVTGAATAGRCVRSSRGVLDGRTLAAKTVSLYRPAAPAMRF